MIRPRYPPCAVRFRIARYWHPRPRRFLSLEPLGTPVGGAAAPDEQLQTRIDIKAPLAVFSSRPAPYLIKIGTSAPAALPRRGGAISGRASLRLGRYALRAWRCRNPSRVPSHIISAGQGDHARARRTQLSTPADKRYQLGRLAGVPSKTIGAPTSAEGFLTGKLDSLARLACDSPVAISVFLRVIRD
jgi:hypothetical protein